MRLIDLDPRWFEALDRDQFYDEKSRAGFTFLCPHCQQTRIAVTTRPLKASDQFEGLAALHPDSHGDIVPAKQMFAWTIDGEDFATISVTPSVDASASGHWHGFIKNGDIV
jgi:hypothetical protein